MLEFILLPHVRHAHVWVEPVHLPRLHVTESQAEAGHALHLVDVHDLLDDTLPGVEKHSRRLVNGIPAPEGGPEGRPLCKAIQS